MVWVSLRMNDDVRDACGEGGVQLAWWVSCRSSAQLWSPYGFAGNRAVELGRWSSVRRLHLCAAVRPLLGDRGIAGPRWSVFSMVVDNLPSRKAVHVSQDSGSGRVTLSHPPSLVSKGLNFRSNLLVEKSFLVLTCLLWWLGNWASFHMFTGCFHFFVNCLFCRLPFFLLGCLYLSCWLIAAFCTFWILNFLCFKGFLLQYS